MDKIDTRTQRQILSKKSKGEGNKKSKNKPEIAVNKTQKGGKKRTKSMMDSIRAKALGFKKGGKA